MPTECHVMPAGCWGCSRENGQGTWGHYFRGGKTRAVTPTLSALPDLAADQAFLVGHLTLGLLFSN